MATKIRQSSLDTSIVTGLSSLGTGAVATTDEVIIYDQSTGALKKISQTALLNFPSITSISPTNVNTGDGTGNHTFTITGTGFTGASATLINASGTAVPFSSVTVNSSTQITGVIAKSSLPDSGEPYDIKVTAATGLANTKTDQVNVNAQPIFNTSSGLLGTVTTGNAGAFFVNAVDPESAGNVTFELKSGSLPPGYTLTNQGVEGGTVKIAGTDNSSSSTTTYNFVLRAVDAASNTSTRSFSITSRVFTSQSFTSSGTFSVPSGISSADVLVVAGGGAANSRHSGGGGAGGLIFMPGVPLTPSGTVTVTVGCGGHGDYQDTSGQGTNGQDSVFGASPSPGTPVTLTAKGGGRGFGSGNGNQGGSGGGAGHNNSCGGTGIQPTQPGNSGAYGFGNPGGTTSGGTSPQSGGSGGGGAAAAGQSRSGLTGPGTVGDGGNGKAYTIADGTTPVFYAGGGGGGSHGPETARGSAGQGGGGQGGGSGNQGSAGQANKGGGAGGASDNEPGGEYAAANARLKGGKGIVIVRF